MSLTFDKRRVYELLLTIPKGRVITYGQLARLMGNRAWARAVGNALHHNPDGDKYPCYKVVNSCGELSRAYAFGGIAEQKRRLEADGIAVENGKVDLKRYGIAGMMGAEAYLGKIVEVFVDRPLGSVHPKHANIVYPINYGYIEGLLGGDGEEQDAYILGADAPVERYIGRVIAVIKRKNDNEDKLVVAPEDRCYSVSKIEALVRFQEQYFDHEIVTAQNNAGNMSCGELIHGFESDT